MKKIIAILLALTFCALVFAGCKTNPDPAQTTTSAPNTEKVDTLENAKQYLYAMYKDAAEKTLKPFKRVGIVTISGEVFDVEWTAKVLTGPEDGIKIVAGDKTVTIEMNETPEEELRYELTATVKKGEESKSVTFTHYVPAVPKAGGIEVVKEVKTDTPFKFGLVQGNLEKTLFFAGENKTYIDVHEYKEGKAGVRLTTEPTATFVWNEELHLFTTNVAGEDRYLGTYNTFNTISASATSYITGDNASKIGVSQFPAYLYAIEYTRTVAEAPAAGKAYKFSLVQGNLEKTLYFTGAMSGTYLATTTSAAAAADVFVEAVEGGYRLYFMAGDAKTYIDIYEYKEGKAGVRLTTEPTAVYTWNEELHIFITNVAGADRYLGTFSTHNTISASATSFITGDNASKIGVSQFPAQLVTLSVY